MRTRGTGNVKKFPKTELDDYSRIDKQQVPDYDRTEIAEGSVCSRMIYFVGGK